MKRGSLPILFVVLIFCYSLAGLLYYLNDIFHTKDEIRNLEQLIQTRTKLSPDLDETEADVSEENKNPTNAPIQSEFRYLYEQNSDFIGWLSIDNTGVNYPVMQDPGGSDYYLEHDFQKEPSIHGLPFLDSKCDIRDSKALMIHGHNMKTGLIFGELMNYKKESFYKDHPQIRFHTLYEKEDYEIIAVILSKVYEKTDNAFRYYQLDNLQTPEGFDSYMEEIKQLALYPTGKTARFSDKLLILSTCEYSTVNGRLAVIARKILS